MELTENSTGSGWGGPYSLTQRIYYSYLLGTYGLVIGVSLAIFSTALSDDGPFASLIKSAYVAIPLLIVGCLVILGMFLLGPFVANRSVIYFARMSSTRGAPSAREMWIRMASEGGVSVFLWAWYGVAPYFAIYTSAAASLTLVVSEDGVRLLTGIVNEYREYTRKRKEKASTEGRGSLSMASVCISAYRAIIDFSGFVFIFAALVIPSSLSLIIVAIACAVIPFLVVSDGLDPVLWAPAAGLYAYSFIDARRRLGRHKRLRHEHSPFSSSPAEYGAWDWAILQGLIITFVMAHPAVIRGQGGAGIMVAMVWVSVFPMLAILGIKARDHRESVSRQFSEDATIDLRDWEHGEPSADTP